MHHGGERPGRGDGRDDVGELVAVGHVARDEDGVGAQRGQLGRQLGCAVRVHAPPGQQHQVAHAVLGDQVPGHQPAQPAGGTGDQHGAVGGEAEAGRLGRVHPGQPRCQQPSTPDSQLRFTGGQRGGQQADRCRHVVHVDQHEPVGVLGLGTAHQAPDGRAGQVRPAGREDRAPRHHGQSGGGEPLVRQPGPQLGQHLTEHVAHGRHHRAGALGARAGQHHDIRGGGARGDGRAQFVQGGERTRVLADAQPVAPAPPVRADEREPRQRRRLGRDRDLQVVHPEQRVARHPAGVAQLLAGHRAHHQ